MQKASSHKQDIIKNTSIFSGSVYISQAIFFIRGFLNAKIIGPELYGLWSALIIILNYSQYVRLGSLNAMAREIPYQNGKGLIGPVERTKNTAFTICLFTAMIFSLALIVIAFLMRERIQLNEFIGLLTIAATAFVVSIFEFYQIFVVAIKKFSAVSRVNIIFSVLSVALTLVFVVRFGIYGVYGIAVLIQLLSLLYLAFKERCRVKICFDLKEMARLINIGLPLGAINFLESSLIDLPSVIVLALLGKSELGYFSVAMLAIKFLTFFPGSIRKAFEPYIYQRYGETDDIHKIRNYVMKTMKAMALLFPVILGAYYILVEFFIRHFLQKYTASINPIFVLSIGVFFVSFSPVSNVFITALNKQKFLIPVYAIGIGIASLASFVFIKMGYGLTGAGFGLALAFFFIGTVTFVYTLGHYVKDIARCMFYTAGLFVPLIYVCLIVMSTGIIISCGHDIFSDTLRLVFRLAILLVLSCPLIYMAEAKTGIISDIIRLLKYNRAKRL
ncbi:MAG: oligosaccharide flippase family protein [Candidatus Omnitrophota bacterium]|nr:oligosaccharide flippase family protein [Candidatus Omnitrophota bacterium]